MDDYKGIILRVLPTPELRPSALGSHSPPISRPSAVPEELPRKTSRSEDILEKRSEEVGLGL